MSDFKKVFSQKLISLIIAAIFLLNNTVYGIALSKETCLRKPLDFSEQPKIAIDGRWDLASLIEAFNNKTIKDNTGASYVLKTETPKHKPGWVYVYIGKENENAMPYPVLQLRLLTKQELYVIADLEKSGIAGRGLGAELYKIIGETLPGPARIMGPVHEMSTRRDLYSNYYVDGDEVKRRKDGAVVTEAALQDILADTVVGRLRLNSGFGVFGIEVDNDKGQTLKNIEAFKWLLGHASQSEQVVPEFRLTSSRALILPKDKTIMSGRMIDAINSLMRKWQKYSDNAESLESEDRPLFTAEKILSSYFKADKVSNILGYIGASLQLYEMRGVPLNTALIEEKIAACDKIIERLDNTKIEKLRDDEEINNDYIEYLLAPEHERFNVWKITRDDIESTNTLKPEIIRGIIQRYVDDLKMTIPDLKQDYYKLKAMFLGRNTLDAQMGSLRNTQTGI